jgi:hypothetical protein
MKCDVVHSDEYSLTFSVPKKWVKIRSPRILSEEQKEQMRARMSGIRKEVI